MGIEIVMKSNHLKSLGIVCFSDLFNPHNIDALYSYFCERFKGFQLVDNRFDRKEISQNIIDKIGNILEPSYWEIHKGKPNLDRKKKELDRLLTNYDLLKTNLFRRNYFVGLCADRVRNSV